MNDTDSLNDGLLAMAAREGTAVFRAAVERFSRDTFYAFCFYTDNDVSSVYPHANTIESLMQVDSSADPNYFKWAPAEWKLDFGQYGDSDFMRETNELLQRQVVSDVEFGERKRQTLITLSHALLNIKNTSVFDGHADLDRLAFWVNIGDASSGEIEWMFEPVVDHMPPDVVEELRALFEFKARQRQVP